jgi:hypothetical protein
MKIPFTKLVMSKKNVCINFSSQLRHICKMCSPVFAKVANCAIFQKTEKKTTWNTNTTGGYVFRRCAGS